MIFSDLSMRVVRKGGFEELFFSCVSFLMILKLLMFMEGNFVSVA